MYLEEYDLIGEEQAGFRSGYSTLDHICSLKYIIDIYFSKNKRLFTAFIDYRKAFDNICFPLFSMIWQNLFQCLSGIRCA